MERFSYSQLRFVSLSSAQRQSRRTGDDIKRQTEEIRGKGENYVLLPLLLLIYYVDRREGNRENSYNFSSFYINKNALFSFSVSISVEDQDKISPLTLRREFVESRRIFPERKMVPSH